MSAIATTTGSIFSTGHIALTAIISGAIASLAGLLVIRGEQRTLDTVATGLLTAAAVFMLRKSANMPQLNNDGLNGFSANDWLAPTLTFVVLGIYAAIRPQHEPRRFQQARAAATAMAFAINVLTI